MVSSTTFPRGPMPEKTGFDALGLLRSGVHVHSASFTYAVTNACAPDANAWRSSLTEKTLKNLDCFPVGSVKVFASSNDTVSADTEAVLPTKTTTETIFALSGGGADRCPSRK